MPVNPGQFGLRCGPKLTKFPRGPDVLNFPGAHTVLLTIMLIFIAHALSGDFLQPDEVAFAVLLRGYGGTSPPNWQKIDATLTTMQLKYGLSPGTSECS